MTNDHVHICKPFKDENAVSNIMEQRPGEVALDISARLFIDSRHFSGLAEWTNLDVMVELSRIFKDSKGIIKRGVIRSYNFPYLRKEKV